jgi:hypothetical protein
MEVAEAEAEGEAAEVVGAEAAARRRHRRNDGRSPFENYASSRGT